MRVLVVGAGAIGGYVGARLALAGHDVTLVGRQALADAVAAHGLRLVEPEREFEIRACRAVTSVAVACEPTARYELALFTVKTYDTQRMIDDLRPCAASVDCFYSLQNGVSSEDLLGEAFGRERVMAGTILNPVSVSAPGVVVLEKRKGGLGVASLRIGPSVNSPTPEAAGRTVNQLAGQLRRAGFRVRAYADARAMKWSKLLLNLIGNAASAILDLNTMQVFADKRAFAIEIAALRETMRVTRSQGIRFVGLPGYPVPLLAAAVRWLPLPILQPLMIPLVARGRGQKMPSLHIDLWNGKRRSEIEDLNGVVVRLGSRLGIPTPANALLLHTYADLQAGRVDRSAWRHRVDRLWEAYRRGQTVTA